MFREKSDPAHHDRSYFRHSKTGDRGYIVQREGKDMIRYDRPMEEIIVPLTPEWLADPTANDMSPLQVAQVAFAADRELCRQLGLMSESRTEWRELGTTIRQRWTEAPPTKAGPRQKLWRLITRLLHG